MKRHPEFGPRIFIKTDQESSVGRGCVEYADHYQPHMSMLKRAAAASAPLAAVCVRFTEGYRNTRDTRDRHEDNQAFDITIEMPRSRGTATRRATRAELEETAQRMRLFMGPAWQFVVHGRGANMHIHAEYEPKEIL